MKKLTPIKSLKDFKQQLKDLPLLDLNAKKLAKTRDQNLTKPPGSLGRLEDIVFWLSSWQGKYPPTLCNPSAKIFAGNHGVAHKGISAYPPEVTQQMVQNFYAGGAAVNKICKTFGVELQIFPIKLEEPTKDFTEVSAMSEPEFLESINIGLMSVKKEADILCLGEMGIGNSSAAAAICTALFDKPAAYWTGLGTGLNKKAHQKKIKIVETAVNHHKPMINGGLDALRRLGGRELSAIAGAILGARLLRVPVLLDGFICSSAAATLEKTEKGALDHCIIAHKSSEAGHKHLLKELKKTPLLDLQMRLGEASGAVLGVGILQAAVNCHNDMLTFKEANVSGKDSQII